VYWSAVYQLWNYSCNSISADSLFWLDLRTVEHQIVGLLCTACRFVLDFTFMWPCIVINFFLIKPTDALISQIYSCQETLHVSGSSSAHNQEISIVPSALVYVMHVWWQLSSTTRIVVLKSCHQTCMTYTSAEGTVENSWWWAEKLPETCRASWQNIFGKLVRLLVLVKRNSLGLLQMFWMSGCTVGSDKRHNIKAVTYFCNQISHPTEIRFNHISCKKCTKNTTSPSALRGEGDAGQKGTLIQF